MTFPLYRHTIVDISMNQHIPIKLFAIAQVARKASWGGLIEAVTG